MDAARSTRAERFPKEHRLRKRRGFLAVQQHARPLHLKDLLVLYAPRPGHSRIGITVSRKVGIAVQRNRIKRLLREAWRRNQEHMPCGFDIVIVAKRSAVTATYVSLECQLRELGRRLRHATPASG